jgi:hypothetical protein
MAASRYYFWPQALLSRLRREMRSSRRGYQERELSIAKFQPHARYYQNFRYLFMRGSNWHPDTDHAPAHESERARLLIHIHPSPSNHPFEISTSTYYVSSFIHRPAPFTPPRPSFRTRHSRAEVHISVLDNYASWRRLAIERQITATHL